MKLVYLAVFKLIKNEYEVTFPDFPSLITHGSDLADALEMAQEVLEGYLLLCEEIEKPIPSPTPVAVLNSEIERDETINIFPVQANTKVARARNSIEYDKRSVTVEHYLNVLAKERKINVSKILNDSLREKLI